MNHTLSDSQLEEMIKSAVNSSGPLPPDEKFSQLVSALRELQERRKAAMDSEPVAYAWVSRSGKKHLTRCEPEQWRDAVILTPLYRHAQPAPVVLKDHQIRELVNQLRDIAIEYHGTQQLRERIARVLRAAMLQAEPVTTANKLGNSPVIPDTWIPVSERNPNDIGRYWCYVEDQNSHGEYSYHWNCSWNGSYWSGAMMYGRVTHWMPLPAAPQEVQGE